MNLSNWQGRWARGLARLQRTQLELRETPSKEEHVVNLVADLRKREAWAAVLEEQLKLAQAEIRYMIETEIPDAMDDAEIDKLKLTDGATLSITTDYIPQIKVEDEDKAFAWIRGAGYADKLKSVVSLEYGMGEDKTCQKVYDWLTKHTLGRAQLRTYMHSATQKAWAREVSEKGLSLPPEISIFSLRKIKIVKARTRAGVQDGS